MPLFLVRWPGLRASIISARNEADLMDQIDEITTPGVCTWKPYRGPIWFNFRVAVDYEIHPKVGGRLRAEEVEVGTPPENFLDFPLEGTAFDDEHSGEASIEMRDAVLRGAFPHLAEVLDATGSDEELAPEVARTAVTADLVHHAADTAFKGVTYDDDTNLVRTETWTFLLRGHRFEETAPTLFEDFCFGLASLRPEPDGRVWAVEVRVYMDRGRPERADVGEGLRLRANKAGMIHPAHRGDAFDGDEDAEGTPKQRFEKRRNASVKWRLDQRELAALARAVNKKAGAPIFAGLREQ